MYPDSSSLNSDVRAVPFFFQLPAFAAGRVFKSFVPFSRSSLSSVIELCSLLIKVLGFFPVDFDLLIFFLFSDYLLLLFDFSFGIVIY